MDPVDFFLSLPNTLEGEAETLYRMRMEELLWRAGRYGEDPTEAFLERLQRQFPGHTAERRGEGGEGVESGGKDGRRELGKKEQVKGEKPTEPALERAPARHPQERLACQTSVLLLEKGAMEVEGEKVKTAIIDTGAQSVMLGKGMAERLGLLAPERHVKKGMLVMTAEGGEPKWMPCTRTPIEVTLLPGGEHETKIRMKCGISESEDFDVLVGTELVYAVGMTICTWTEKVEFWTRYWKKEGPLGELPVRFVKVEPKRAYQAAEGPPPVE
ncbi:unnamed protein product [Closterium sp. NIES-54]